MQSEQKVLLETQFSRKGRKAILSTRKTTGKQTQIKFQ